MLLAAVVVVWGVVAWKIKAPAPAPATAPPQPAPLSATGPAADTLRCDYPDPFLKGALRPAAAERTAARIPASVKAAARRREAVRIVHRGTVRAGGRGLHILTVGDVQYELERGDTVAGFTLAACDRDSLYLRKDGLTYGVKRCGI